MLANRLKPNIIYESQSAFVPKIVSRNRILPTLTNLFKRNVVSPLTCHLCGEWVETEGQVLWGCAFVEKIWRANPVFSAAGGN